MTNIVQFKKDKIVGTEGTPKVDQWLFYAYSNYVRSDFPSVNVDCFEAKLFIKDLIEHGFTPEQAEAFVNNLDKAFLDITRTALMVGEAHGVGILGLTHGYAGGGRGEMLLLAPVFEGGVDTPAVHTFFYGPLGSSPLSELEISEFVKKVHTTGVEDEPRVVTKDEAKLPQEAIDKLDAYFINRVKEEGKYYQVRHGPTDKTQRQKVTSYLLYDGYGFIGFDLLTYREEHADLFDR